MTAPSAWTSNERWIHGFAVLLMVLTLGLLYVGGLVTTYEVGMAVPDWPSTYGENMFLYNFFDKSWGIILEHSHRLFGSVIGLISIGLAVTIFRFETRPWVRWLGPLQLLMVIAQGVIGGQRVQLNAWFGDHLAAFHGCFGQAFFAMTVAMACFTSRWFREAKPIAHPEGSSVRQATLLLAGAMYLQIVLGAVVRHYEGSLWIVHLVLGGVLFFASLWVMMLSLLHRPVRDRLGSAVMVLGGGLVGQITLGLLALFLTGLLDSTPHTKISMQEAVTVTTHLALGSILMGVSVYLAVAARRLFAAAGEHALSPTNQPMLESVA